jgi:hypothetical protein
MNAAAVERKRKKKREKERERERERERKRERERDCCCSVAMRLTDQTPEKEETECPSKQFNHFHPNGQKRGKCGLVR